MQVSKTDHKRVLIHSYSQISELEKVIKAFRKSRLTKVTVSVLGNFDEDYSDNLDDLVYKSNYLQGFFQKLLGPGANLDSFYNTSTGRIFVIGFLAPMFLHQVGEKKLGALSGGPYGILRGLGITEVKAMDNVKKLHDGQYLLLIRGNYFDLEKLEDILEKLKSK